MSSDAAIRLQRVNKIFRLYARPHQRLLGALPWSRVGHRTFHALRDIDLNVQRGETLGIVGRNGSGKSTLLQVICGILTPTSGDVTTTGRIAALLELGAGFNPEFTGRENVFLNAAVMGLERHEVESRFDDIVAFSEIGQFLDQPVKTYSSGMFVRLAFSVAINVDPDILVIDEALAVGDESFQRKCYARIRAIRNNGATVLFVSHGAATVLELCDRAVLLDDGEMLAEGSPKSVMACFHKLLYAPRDEQGAVRASLAMDFAEGEQRAETDLPGARRLGGHDAHRNDHLDSTLVPSTLRYPSQGAIIDAPRVLTTDGRHVNVLTAGDSYVYAYRATFDRHASHVRCGMMIKTVTGLEIGGAASAVHGGGVARVEPGDQAAVEIRFRCLLAPGTYFINAGVLGRIEETEVFLARCVDATMFRVMHQPDRLATGMVDFEVDPKVTLVETERGARGDATESVIP